MTLPIQPDSFAAGLARIDAPSTSPVSEGSGAAPGTGEFADRLGELLEDVNGMQTRAQEASDAYASGSRNDMHGTMIALEQADISFRLVTNIRGRLVEAYREVMRMGA